MTLHMTLSYTSVCRLTVFSTEDVSTVAEGPSCGQHDLATGCARMASWNNDRWQHTWTGGV